MIAMFRPIYLRKETLQASKWNSRGHC